jgi:guanylate cyclase
MPDLFESSKLTSFVRVCFRNSEVIMQVTRDVAQGLRYLHSSKPPILHGDLKGRNILVDSRFRAKLCDFGLSSKHKNLITGTPFWLAPEYLRGETTYNTTCDIYSVGIILYEIYSRQNPYQGEHFRDTLRKICDPRVNKRPPVPACCPPKMADLMKKCWSPDPFFRPEAKDLDSILLDTSTNDAEPLQGDQDQMQRDRATSDMLDWRRDIRDHEERLE